MDKLFKKNDPLLQGRPQIAQVIKSFPQFYLSQIKTFEGESPKSAYYLLNRICCCTHAESPMIVMVINQHAPVTPHTFPTHKNEYGLFVKPVTDHTLTPTLPSYRHMMPR